MCLICNESLASESMKPIKLKKHLTTRHASNAEKPLMYFERLLQSEKTQKLFMENMNLPIPNIYAHLIKPPTYLQRAKSLNGEELVLPVAVRMTETIYAHKYADEF